MSGDLAQYAKHFQEGTRVRVGVPLAGGGSFQEWGVVGSLERDLLELDLSRDFLPQQASLRLGGIIDLGLLDPEGARHCRAMVAGEFENHRLLLRLIESVTVFEPREFFRQDVYLPLDYRLPPRQIGEEIRERWRQRLWAREFAAQSRDPEEAGELDALREEIRGSLEGKKAAPPAAANISGGGVRLNICERLRPGMLIELSIQLPDSQRVLEMVGEVVQVRALPDRTGYSTALRYRFIDEADRDRLIGYISARQLSQLAQQAPRWQGAQRSEPAAGSRRLRLAVGVAILAALVGFQLRAIVVKRERGEKHEIARIFEKAIADYLRERR
ncbi:MAG: pilus assembly protein PilZ [Geobacteraceae bacterium GWC2_58_44]|nr:MAG: pilus assembly protein PilZ [Geobacteraceae bacterium GWC2_58_44]HBG05192.1 PilZ domain-containing protein [Geobacter sp.]